MPRKTSISIGLPDDVLQAVEQAQLQLYEQAVKKRIAGSGFSRALTIEILLTEALKARGIVVGKRTGRKGYRHG